MPSEEVRRMIGLPRSEVEKFESRYGEGRLSWILTLLLAEFNLVGTLTPNDYAHLAARILQTKIDDAS